MIKLIKEIGIAKLIKKLSGYSFINGIGLLLGFVRELIIAAIFGLSKELDVYLAILGLYQFVGAQIGNAVENAFVSKIGKVGKLHVLNNIFVNIRPLLLLNVGILFAFIFFGEALIKLAFPAFDAQQTKLGLDLMWPLFFAAVCVNFAGLLRGGLYVHKCFAPGFVAGAIVSILNICFVLAFSGELGVKSIALGVFVGNVSVLFLYGFFVYKYEKSIHSELIGKTKVLFSRDDQVVYKILGATSIVLIGEILFQVSSIIQRSFASQIQVGAISAFFYASTLVMVPLTLFVHPIITVVFPRMTELLHINRLKGIALIKVSALMLFIFTSIIVFLTLDYTDFIVRIIYLRGKFSEENAKLTAEIFSILIFLLPFMSLSRLIRYAFYSSTDYKTPILGNMVNLIVLLVLGNYLIQTSGVRGLAYAVVAAEASRTLLMIPLLIRRLRNE